MRLYRPQLDELSLDDYTLIDSPESNSSVLREELRRTEEINRFSWREVELFPTEDFIAKEVVSGGWQPAVESGCLGYAVKNNIRHICRYTTRISGGHWKSFTLYELILPISSRHKFKLEQLFEEGKQVNAQTQKNKNLVYGPPTELKTPRVYEYLFAQAVDKSLILPMLAEFEEKHPFDFRNMLCSLHGTKDNITRVGGFVQEYEQKTPDNHLVYKYIFEEG